MSPIRPTAPVLVPGATGFIGREVVRCLLRAGRPVLALARRKAGISAAARVAAAVGTEPDGSRLQVLEADLARPGCGMGESEWRRLRVTTETVIHCAGEAVFFPRAMGPFRAAHIDGPLALLQGLREGRLRRWAHLSTAYVCGKRSRTVLESEGDVGQEFHNPYERVKLEAERALQAAGAALRLDVRVFRPSIVVGAVPETAGGSPSDLFFGFIRMAAALARLSNGSQVPLRIAGAPRARFNIVPVEYVAEAVVALADHPEGAGGTFHLVVSDPPTQEAMLGMITARLGLRGLTLVDARQAPLDHPTPLERRVARMLSVYREYLEQDVRFDDAIARRLLDRCGVSRPSLSPGAVDRLIAQALTASPLVGVAPAGELGGGPVHALGASRGMPS